ncbi:hypothetical protein AgCh_003122 [Apium graveolens]
MSPYRLLSSSSNEVSLVSLSSQERFLDLLNGLRESDNQVSWVRFARDGGISPVRLVLSRFNKESLVSWGSQEKSPELELKLLAASDSIIRGRKIRKKLDVVKLSEYAPCERLGLGLAVHLLPVTEMSHCLRLV